MFIVTCEGVYRHEIVGIYTNLELAKQEALRVCKAQRDDHHHFYILYMPPNETYCGNIGGATSDKDTPSENSDQCLLQLIREDQRLRSGGTRSYKITWKPSEGNEQVLKGDEPNVPHITDPAIAFAYALMNGDPVAKDAFEDIVNARSGR